MQGSIYLTIATISFVFLISIKYFFKEKEKTFNNKIYSKLLIITLLSLISELCLSLFYTNELLREIFMRIYLSCAVIWIFIIFGYLLNVLYKEKIEKINYKIVNAFLLLLSIGIFVAPVDYIYDDAGKLIYSSGPAVILAFGVGFLVLFAMLLLLMGNLDKIKKQEFHPILLLILLLILSGTIQVFIPGLLLINFSFGLTISLMYHTIENTDEKMAEYEKYEKERAEAASLAKSEFLSSMSHELRTPLNAIVGLSEDIDSFADKVPEEVREDTKDIINASNTLLEIIGSILDISKIESGKLDIIESDYDPREEFDSLAKIMRTKFNEKSLEFNVSLGENIPEVLYGDRLRIKQIVNNLLSNACKYTDAGHVDFKVEWLDASSSLRIIVKDTGHGVKPEDVDKLFAKYDRLGVEKTSSVQGTGLGLAITKTLIDLMGGQVRVDSELMIGTTFTVVLPQKIGDKDALEAIRRENERKVEKVDYTGKRLLVVDDNMLNIKVFKKAVKDYNFTIDECYNGKEAIEKIEMNNNYDIVLLDIKMPIMNGEETIKYIRTMPNFNSVVIALTADAMTGASEKYTAMGFDDYLPKPFTRDVVSRKITSILGNGKEENKPTKKTKNDNLENTATINVLHADVTVNNYHNTDK